MQQSNAYIIGFATVTTIILGGLLSMAAVFLKVPQTAAKDLDTKYQILKAVMPEVEKGKSDIIGIYGKRIESFVVDANGDKIEGDVVAEKVDKKKEFKKKPEERVYPVFRFVSESNPDETEAYILPVFGNGLWDNIWGYIALSNDFEIIKGVVFDHKGETPGLGARITDAGVQARYKGKKIYKEEDGKKVLASVTMLKAETGNTLTDYNVDGMSGATMTADGVNKMLRDYLGFYQPFFDKTSSDKPAQESVQETETVESDSVMVASDSLQAVTDSTTIETKNTDSLSVE